ncbi:MAG: phosphopantetheine-binding protein [Xanthobacteraceae bacterium]
MLPAVNQKMLFESRGPQPLQTKRLSETLLTVLDRTTDTVADRVAALVRQALVRQTFVRQATDKQSINKTVGNDDDLRASGLSSLGLVNLMLSVETEFDLKIPERDMTPANFRSIARIAELVRTLSPQPAAAE